MRKQEKTNGGAVTLPYIDFRAHLKKVNLKPKGVKEIVLEVSDSCLDGKLDELSRMIDQKVEIEFDSTVVSYNVTMDISTNQPTTQYHVDSTGSVKEVKIGQEQLEADLGVARNKPRTKEEEKEIDREVINKFILEGLAPEDDEFPKDFVNIVKRRLEGESFSKLAGELDISSGTIVILIEQYLSKVAPLAQTWWDWKQSQNDQNE